MATEWTVSMNQTFLAQWLALPLRENRQVQEKVRMLLENPLPDGKVRKQLKHINAKLHRIRSGDYRIFYTFEKPYVSLLEVSKRDEDTYNFAPSAETLGGLSGAMPPAPTAHPVEQRSTPEKHGELSRSLPANLTPDLLTRLKVPEQ